MDGPRKKAGLLMLLLLLPAQLMASDQMLEVGLGVDAQWFDWREYNRSGEELLLESGPMLLGRGDIRVQAGDFFSKLAFSWGGGKAHYDGQLNITHTPYETDAWEEMRETELQVGAQQRWGNLHVGLMQRDWDRQIEGRNGVSSVHEAYRWRLLTVGGEYRLRTTATASTSLAVDLGLPVDSDQKVYSDAFADYNLEPGNGHFWRMMLHWRQGAWELSPFLQQQTMDVSNRIQRRNKYNGLLYNIEQPESTRLEGGLRLRYVFGEPTQSAITP